MKKEHKNYLDQIRGKLPKWVSIQNLVFLLVFLAFFFIIIWSESLSHIFTGNQSSEIMPLITPTILPGTPTPLPQELLRTGEQTNGVLMGAIIVVAAIVTGTIAILVRDR